MRLCVGVCVHLWVSAFMCGCVLSYVGVCVHVWLCAFGCMCLGVGRALLCECVRRL